MEINFFQVFVLSFLFNMAQCSLPLNMEVEWCLQGNTASFTGFFTEILGYSSGLREMLPKSRLVKSLFGTSLEEPVIRQDAEMYHEIFEKEKDNIRYLAADTHYPILMKGGSYLKFMHQTGEVDALAECLSPEFSPLSLGTGEKMFQESARPVATLPYPPSSDPTSPSEKTSCCQACSEEPLCLAWSLSDKSCRLQSRFERAPSAVVTVPEPTFSSSLKSRKFQTPRAVIFHGTMCGYRNRSISGQRRDVNTIYIGRYMFERGSAALQKGMSTEEYKVFMCMLLMDEVWVPTEWMRTQLMQLSRLKGYNFPVLAVVPEAVDTTLFDPASVVDRTEVNGARDKFQFLSIFKWEDRKGWDVLLQAYWTAFSAADDVVLRLHTYRPGFLANQGQVNITENLVNFAAATFGKDLSDLARVTIADEMSDYAGDVCSGTGDMVCDAAAADAGGKERSDNLNRAEMRELLHSSDAFVLPTRGEGWCLPAAEAMSMALPVIITNYSGPTAFATDENSYLIPVNGTQSDGFAEPDMAVLVTLLQHVKSNPDEAREKGQRARAAMEELSPRRVAGVMADRLRDLARMRGWEE